MDQQVLFHKKLTNSTMVFNNSRNLLTSKIKRNPMITRIDSTLTKSQIQVLMLKLKLIQMQLSEKQEEITRKPTMPIFLADQTSFLISTVLPSSENNPTDGKETQTTPVKQKQLVLSQTELLLLRLLLLSKRKLTQIHL
jgi:hypothetical protein